LQDFWTGRTLALVAMGKVLSCDCFDFLMPSPEASKAAYYGNSKDVHSQPAPDGSLLLIGYISLQMPRKTPTRTFYGSGFGLPQTSRNPKELRFSVGPTQLRFPIMSEETEEEADATLQHDGFNKETGYLDLMENVKRCDPFFYQGKDHANNERRLGDYSEAQQWPGDFNLWVDDVRNPYDKFNLLKSQYPRDLIVETFEPKFAGEQGLVIRDPWAKNFFRTEEAPPGAAETIRGCCASGDGQSSNTLAVIGVQYRLRSSQAIAAIARFYTECLQAAVDEKPDSCVVHFAPTKGFHQTLTFMQDAQVQSSGNPGVICMYASTDEQFRKAFEACSQKPGFSGGSLASGEFELSACVDPKSGQAVVPLKHVIRSPKHAECPLVL